MDSGRHEHGIRQKVGWYRVPSFQRGPRHCHDTTYDYGNVILDCGMEHLAKIIKQYGTMMRSMRHVLSKKSNSFAPR